MCTSINILSKRDSKGRRDPTEKHFGVVFLLDTLKTLFWMENLTQSWRQSRPILPEWNHLFRFWKSAGEVSSPLHPFLPHPRLSVWLNVYQYPWICLNILENAWMNCSDYARTVNMGDHLTCLRGFWRCFGF